MNWFKWFRIYNDCVKPPSRFRHFNEFADERLNTQFPLFGYAVIRSGKKDLLKKIRKEFEESLIDAVLDSDKGFINTCELPDGPVKSKQTQLLKEHASELFDGIFKIDVDVQPEVFFLKPPNRDSEVALHQDALIVDERSSVGYHCWIPLQDSNAENGGLQVIPGSHLIPNLHRAYSIPWKFEGQAEVLRKHVKTVDMEFGDILIYDRSLIHCSPTNKSESPRLAMAYTVSKRPLQFIHLLPNKKNAEMVDIFNVSPEFLMNEDPFSAPVGLEPFKSEPLENDNYSDTQLQWVLQRIKGRLTKNSRPLAPHPK